MRRCGVMRRWLSWCKEAKTRELLSGGIGRVGAKTVFDGIWRRQFGVDITLRGVAKSEQYRFGHMSYY
jgi:hypothetical protein